MFGFNPVILLVNMPVPVPSIVFVFNEIVGFAVVLQHKPLAVMVAPPSDDMFPPLVAVVFKMLLIEVVETVGIAIGNVLNVRSEP